MNSITFTKATENDISTIFQLAEKIWNKHYISIISQSQIDYMLDKMYSKKAILEQMQQGHVFMLVKSDDEAIGYFSYSIESTKIHLHKIYVSEEKQNSGVGAKILDFLIKINQQCKTIELTVNRKNFKSINFYFKNNFRIERIADFDIGNGYQMNDFIMIKSI